MEESLKKERDGGERSWETLTGKMEEALADSIIKNGAVGDGWRGPVGEGGEICTNGGQATAPHFGLKLFGPFFVLSSSSISESWSI